MATQTPALQLVKPTVGDPNTGNVWGNDLNRNFDKIDNWTGPLPSRIAALEAAVDDLEAGGTIPAHTHPVSQISDSTPASRGLVTTLDAATGLIVQTGVATFAKRTHTISTSPPSGGVDGDVWYQVS